MTMAQSTGCMRRGLDERSLQPPEAGEDDDQNDDHLDVAGSHSARLRSRRRTVAAASDSRTPLTHARSSASRAYDASSARAVSSGAGPPTDCRTATKWRALVISASSASL